MKKLKFFSLFATLIAISSTATAQTTTSAELIFHKKVGSLFQSSSLQIFFDWAGSSEGQTIFKYILVGCLGYCLLYVVSILLMNVKTIFSQKRVVEEQVINS